MIHSCKKNHLGNIGYAATQNKTASAPAAKSPQEQDAVVRYQHRPAIGHSALCLLLSKRCANGWIYFYLFVLNNLI